MAWWIVPAVYALLLAAPSVTLPEADLGIRRFRTPPLTPDLQLSQSFSMTADGLHAIEVFPAATSGPSSGHVRFELYDVHEVGTEHQESRVRSVEVPVGQLRTGSPYQLEFAPLLDSKDRSYRLDLGADVVTGVAFWATKGVGYQGGTLSANGRGRWADLAFRTYAPVPTVWGRLMTLREMNAARAYVVIAAFAAIWILVALVIRQLVVVSGDADAA